MDLIGVVDVETTIINKGNPFTKNNKLVAVGIKIINAPDIPPKVFFEEDFAEAAVAIAELKMLVGMNIKFDLHWLQQYGMWGSSRQRVWDCQLAYHLLTHQQNPYPSLNQISKMYELGEKIDAVSTDYWEKGIDTDKIPRSVLKEYLIQDLHLTEQCYLAMSEDSRLSKKQKLLSLMNQDLIVLQQMEYNGMMYDSEGSRKKAKELEEELNLIQAELKGAFNVNHPVNWNSHDELSTLLYGGTVVIERSVQMGVYKTGKRSGEAKFKKVGYPVVYPRIVEPIPGTELKKEGYWKTDAPTLEKLKFPKSKQRLKELLARRSEIEKLKGTYLEALPALVETMEWDNNLIHGQFNQCVAITGRLSSSKPNLQNLSPDAKEFFRSRYA